MISPQEIVTHLRTYLPAVSTLFSDNLAATATSSSNIVTVSSANHGLSVGSEITVQSGKIQNRISEVTLYSDGITQFTVLSDHDLVAPQTEFDPQTLTLAGMGEPWDGDHVIHNVPNRRTFEIKTPASENNPPVLVNAFLLESRSAGFVGTNTVSQIVSNDIFRFIISDDVPALPNGKILDVKIAKSVRVEGAADFSRATQIYTQYNADKPYLFVMMSDGDVSKDRHSSNDSIASFTAQNMQKQMLLQNFTVIAFIPTAQSDTSAFKAQNQAYSVIYPQLIKCLYGFRFNDVDTAQQYVTVTNGHGPAEDANSSYYAHGYDWQLPTVLTYKNGFDFGQSVAFRNITQTLDLDENAQLISNIDLDQEVL